MNFAEKLKMIRKERNITQEELAELLSVSRQAVSKWESGTGYPETEKLLIISKELNVSLDYLLLDETVLEEKKKKEEKPVVYATGGRIAIPTHDRKSIVSCLTVKSSAILGAGKDEPKYILNGINKVTFWGEHSTLLGWYTSEEDIEKEIKAITDAIANGRASYELQYNAEVELKGFFGQPRLKNNK